MYSDSKKIRDQALSDDLPRALPNIALQHGQAVWVMTELGFRGTATPLTFYQYIKSLRKLGIPFEAGDIGLARRGLAYYSYPHLMELALALTLRVYNAVPDPVLSGIVLCRERLYRLYRQAYAERRIGKGAPIVLETDDCSPIQMRGVFLDLQLDFSGGRLVTFGPPKSLSPHEAVSNFATRDLAARALLPIGLSLLAERVVALSLRAPLIRRGPQPTPKGADRPPIARPASQSSRSRRTI